MNIPDQKTTNSPSSHPHTAGVNWVEHPLRYALTNELHARPFEMLSAPVQASHYACVLGEGDRDSCFDHLKVLCDRYGVHVPSNTISHFSGDFGTFRLRFERHTEFVSYTVFREGPFADPFAKPAAEYLPDDWLSQLPGELLVATHLTVLPADQQEPELTQLFEYFVPESLVMSTVSNNAAKVWTDLRIHADGHNRILLHTLDMPPAKAGRVVQRLLEVATYRNFALLALPVAREVSPQLSDIDRELSALTDAMAVSGEGAFDAKRDPELLTRITKISAQIEKLNSQHSYRFSAARAYAELIQARLHELDEQRHHGYQTIKEFLDRRLLPAMRTCQSVETRVESLSRRAMRAADLLRTRVDFLVEKQNQTLLTSMDKRAQLQLRLQQTVEGLSVAAITYYTVGLVGYAVKGAYNYIPWLDPSMAQAVAVPVVAIGVWLAMHRIKRKLHQD